MKTGNIIGGSLRRFNAKSMHLRVARKVEVLVLEKEVQLSGQLFLVKMRHPRVLCGGDVIHQQFPQPLEKIVEGIGTLRQPYLHAPRFVSSVGADFYIYRESHEERSFG